MKWRDVNHTHDGLFVEVRDTASIQQKTIYEMSQPTRWVGKIVCKQEKSVPFLERNNGHSIHTFPRHFTVEILD